MRNSNHAIKFLLAQYRAIFKRAYIKGLASAVLLTAGLAAGQAQAAAIDQNLISLDNLQTSGTITITGLKYEQAQSNAYTKIQTIGGSQTNFNGELIIESGSANTAGGNFIASNTQGATSSLSGQGTLTINLTAGDAKRDGLQISGNNGDMTVSLKAINVKNGLLKITDKSNGSGTTKVSANDITIGGTTGAGYLTLEGQTDKGVTLGRKADTNGSGASTIKIADNGKLELKDGSSNANTNTIEGALLSVESGGLFVTSSGTANTINSDVFDVESGGFHVISGSEATSETFSGHVGDIYGNVLVGAKGTLTLANQDKTNDVTGEIITEANVTVHSGANFQLTGALSISGGTLTIEDGAQFYATNNVTSTSGAVSVSSSGTLAIDADTLTEFLTGKIGGSGDAIKYQAITPDGDSYKLGSDALAASGGILLSGGRLELTSADSIVLSDYQFSGGASAKAGHIVIDTSKSNTIAAADLVIENQLSGAGSAKLNSTDSKLKIEADHLTLGSKELATATDFGFKQAYTKHLNVAAQTGNTFTLKNKIFLDVTLNGSDLEHTTEVGSVNGDMTIGTDGQLVARHGTFTSSDDITISGGKLIVNNSNLANSSSKLGSKLTLDGNLLTLNAVQGSTITVNGGDVAAATVLDLQNAKLELNSGDKSATVQAISGGTLMLKGEQLTELLQDFSASASGKSGSKVSVNDGTINVVDSVTLNAAKLSTMAADHTLSFDSSNGGTLEVDGTLTLNGVSDLNLGANGTIIAHDLRLNNEDQQATDDTAVLKSGKYVAQTALSSHDTTDTIHISGSNAKVFLGDFNKITAGTDTYYEAVSETGSINSNLKISDSGELTVQAGAWSGSNINIDVEAGTLNVGLAESTQGFYGIGVKHNSAGDVIGASLTLSDLKVGTAGAATIAAGSELDVTTLTVKADAGDFKVAGVVNVTGKYTPESTKDGDTTPALYGIDLSGAEGSIKVTQGGVLSFGAEATKAITLDPASDDADKDAIAVASGSFGNKIFSVAAGGTIAFSFSSGDVFSAEALTDMRSKLFTDLNSDGLVAGTINLGDARLAGVTADSDGAYKWDDLQGYSDVADFTTDDIKRSVVKGIDAGDNIRGHFGALRADSINAGGQITIVGDTSLNNAAAVSGDKFAVGNGGAILGLNVTKAALVQLNGGGAIGAVNLDEGATLSINHDQSITAPSKTTIDSISGGTAQFGVGESEVTGRTEVNNLINNAGTVTFKDRVTVGDASSSSDAETLLGGVATTFEQDATFYNDTEIAGGMTTFQDGVTFNSGAGIYGDTTVSGGAVFGASAEIGGASTLTADSIELSGSYIRFSVGEEDYVENGETQPGSTGYLVVDSLKLNDNFLVVDPSYEHETSVAFVKNFTDGDSKEDAGIFSGSLIAGQNAALIVGTSEGVYDEALSFIEHYQNSRGALIQDQVGSIVYIGDKLTAENGSRIILESQRTQDEIFGTTTIRGAIDDGSYSSTYRDGTAQIPADLFLGQNTVLGINDNVLADGVAIHFESDDAAIMAQSVKDSSDAAKIVLDGNGFLDSRSVTLFNDTGSDKGVKILGDQDIRVETLNGVMYFTLVAGTETTGGTLKLDTTKIDTAYLGATDVSRDLLFAYSSQTANWDEYFDQANFAKPDSDETKIQRERLHGATASSNLYTYDSTNGFKLSQDAQAAGYQTSDFVVIEHTDDAGNTTAQVYHRAYNDLLERIVRDTNGAAADGAALQGVFGGAAQAALLAARTSQDAVAGRTGMGANKSALTFADNGQGAGLWVAPIYVSQDSDGFAVSNKDYGVDIDLYGVALGGDYTLSNGLRVGAFFNVGTGDADGNGQAGGVSNDFDYYGVGLYAGYTLGQFSIVGDVSYTVVDSDIDASTQVGSIKSSFDTDNISVGVTGQYEFVLGGAQITPHAGLRYNALSFDDSTFAAGGYDNGGHSELDDVNVFSIPVGVTVAKEFAFDTWTVKPSFDVTLQGNFGDDELDSNAQWDGVAWQSTYTAEFLDNFTYGATLGVAAKTGSFSAGLGLGYTGSENTDEFSATANARFTF